THLSATLASRTYFIPRGPGGSDRRRSPARRASGATPPGPSRTAPGRGGPPRRARGGRRRRRRRRPVCRPVRRGGCRGCSGGCCSYRYCPREGRAVNVLRPRGEKEEERCQEPLPSKRFLTPFLLPIVS